MNEQRTEVETAQGSEADWRGQSLSQQMDAARCRQAGFRLESEVRQAARARGLEAKVADELVQRARGGFVFVNGEPQAVEGERKTAMRREDGGLLTVEDWVGLTVAAMGPAAQPKAVGTFGPSPVAVPGVKKNPYRRGSWNLTEQMRIQWRDPELAARLKREAGV